MIVARLPHHAGGQARKAAAAAACRLGGVRRLAQPPDEQPLGLVVGDQARLQELPGTNSE